MISESTYATTIRDSKRLREGEFLSKVRHGGAGEGRRRGVGVWRTGRMP